MKSEIASLAEKRRQENNRVLQATKPLQDRIQELETESVRLIDLAIDQENRLEELHDRVSKLEARLLLVVQAVKEL